MKKTLVLIDFDHTIFNTTKYVAALRERLVDGGVAPEIFDEKRQYLKECCSIVDIDTFILHLPVTNKKLLHDTIHQTIVDVAASCVHSDVAAFFARASACADVVIVTNGDHELQTEKVLHSNLPSYKELIITKEPKNHATSHLVAQYAHVLFVDDKTKHLDEVKQAFPQVTTYHLRRSDDMPYGAIMSTCHCADYEVKGLSDITVCAV